MVTLCLFGKYDALAAAAIAAIPAAGAGLSTLEKQYVMKKVYLLTKYVLLVVILIQILTLAIRGNLKAYRRGLGLNR